MTSGPLKQLYTRFSYETIPGFFVQSDPEADATSIGPNPIAFGLTNHASPLCWTEFKKSIAKMQTEASPGVRYAVCWLGRHGEGWHNVIQELHGGKAWHEHWSRVDSDGTNTLVDAELTKLGEEQARKAASIWTAELQRYDPVPLPTKFFCSPLTRVAQTLEITFSSQIGMGYVRPYIMENLRERNGLRTCNKRRSKIFLQNRFPWFEFEPGFTEEDEAWSPTTQESDEAFRIRLKQALDAIFSSLLSEKDTYFSITAHILTITNILHVIGHREYPLDTGGVIRVVIRATPETI